MESCVPPGFRFHPTDEELVGYYLRKKVASQKIDLDVIKDIDLYRIEPWDLQEKCWIGYEEQNEWYFFSHKDKKYPTGTRTNRATLAGFWKATGRDKAVYDKNKLIGMRKTLVFYRGRAPNGQKTDWIMHEYRLESDENGPPQEEGWVVCRAFKKRASGQSKTTIERWDSSYLYDEPSGGVCSSASGGIIDQQHPVLEFIPRQPPQLIKPTSSSSSSSLLLLNQQNMMCKKEIEAENMNNFMQYCDPFLQLPQLESPSLPLLKRSSSISLISESCNNEELDDHRRPSRGLMFNNNNNNNQKVTDWRALDKFVASQLSQEDGLFDGIRGGTGSVHEHDSNNNNDIKSDMEAALLLMQNNRANGDDDDDDDDDQVENIYKGCFLRPSASLDSDFGLCIFEK